MISREGAGSRKKMGLRLLLLVFFFVLAIERLMTVVQIDLAAANPRRGDLRRRFERVAVADKQRRVLAFFERADAVGNAENLGRVKRDRFERLVSGQAEPNGGGRVIGQVANLIC